MFVPPLPKLYVEILTPKVMVFGGAAFGRRLGHEGGALRNRIDVLIRTDTRALAFCLCSLSWEDTMRRRSCATPKRTSAEHEHTGALTLDLQGPEE